MAIGRKHLKPQLLDSSFHDDNLCEGIVHCLNFVMICHSANESTHYYLDLRTLPSVISPGIDFVIHDVPFRDERGQALWSRSTSGCTIPSTGIWRRGPSGRFDEVCCTLFMRLETIKRPTRAKGIEYLETHENSITRVLVVQSSLINVSDPELVASPLSSPRARVGDYVAFSAVGPKTGKQSSDPFFNRARRPRSCEGGRNSIPVSLTLFGFAASDFHNGDLLRSKCSFFVKY